MKVEPDRDDVVRDLLRQARPGPAVDPARAARVRRAVHAAWVEQQAPRPIARVWWIGAAAAAAALVTAAVLMRLPADPAATGGNPDPAHDRGAADHVAGVVLLAEPGSPSRPLRRGDRLHAHSVLTTGPDGFATIVLANGIHVRLDRQTGVRFVSGGDRFSLDLDRGAIYVDTSPRPERGEPLVVRARGVLLQDIGTRYETRVSSNDVRVRVRDGRVQATRAGVMREAPAGSQLVVTPAGMQLSPAPAFGDDWNWITRAIRPPQVEGRSLAEFLVWVEREGGRRIRFGDQSLERAAATTVVYGVIDGLSVEEALAVVLSTCGLAHRTDGGIITIVAADDARGGR